MFEKWRGQWFEMSRRKTNRGPSWTGHAVLTGLALVLLLFVLPLLFLTGEEEEREMLPTATLPAVEPVNVSPVPGWDESQTIRVLQSDGTVETMTLADYLWGVVAAEMPASFQTEALKAQTVAARTYCFYQRAGSGDKHPGADVCTDYTCCQAFLTREQAAVGWGENARRYTDKVAQAVADTDGLLCLYNGQPIDAVFFSSSAGRTLDAAQVWGNDVPYLTAVDSPEGEEVPGWHTQVTLSLAECAAKLREKYPEIVLPDDPAAWFSDLTADENGAVASVKVGDITLTGTQARSVFGLRSTHFTVEVQDGTVIFRVLGYGHGVGMSQYGANALAEEGKTFDEILKWYYTGVTVAGWEAG